MVSALMPITFQITKTSSTLASGMANKLSTFFFSFVKQRVFVYVVTSAFETNHINTSVWLLRKHDLFHEGSIIFHV